MAKETLHRDSQSLNAPARYQDIVKTETDIDFTVLLKSREMRLVSLETRLVSLETSLISLETRLISLECTVSTVQRLRVLVYSSYCVCTHCMKACFGVSYRRLICSVGAENGRSTVIHE